MIERRVYGRGLSAFVDVSRVLVRKDKALALKDDRKNP